MAEKIKYILTTSEYRALSKLEKGVKLVVDGVCGQESAAKMVDVDRTSIRRVIAAFKCLRPIGCNGRAPALEPFEEINLIVEVLNKDVENTPLTSKQAGDVVGLIFLFFFVQFNFFKLTYSILFCFYRLGISGKMFPEEICLIRCPNLVAPGSKTG